MGAKAPTPVTVRLASQRADLPQLVERPAFVGFHCTGGSSVGTLLAPRRPRDGVTPSCGMAFVAMLHTDAPLHFPAEPTAKTSATCRG